MKHYLVTFFHGGFPDAVEAMMRVLEENFVLWGCEMDAGLFFISAEAVAPQVMERLSNAFELEMTQVLYVFEITPEWDSAGAMNVFREIEKRVPRAS